jgi:hypothetical protein
VTGRLMRYDLIQGATRLLEPRGSILPFQILLLSGCTIVRSSATESTDSLVCIENDAHGGRAHA